MIDDIITIKQCHHNYQKLALINYMLEGGDTCVICSRKFCFNDLYSNPYLLQHHLFSTLSITLASKVAAENNIDDCWTRKIDVKDSHINKASSNYSTLLTLCDDNRKHAIYQVYKYVYQSRLSLEDTVKLLINQGYFVYDLFLRSQHGFLKEYVLYSADKLLDGSTNKLCKLKK